MIDVAFLLSLLLAAPKPPSDQEPTATYTQRVEVVALAPLGGWGVAADRAPVHVQTIGGEPLGRGGGNLAAGLARQTARVAIEEVQGSPRQADLLFRGFRASPLLGSPQGLAVYQDGVRLNDPFGDTVRWDFVPQGAVDRLHLLPGAHPLFGLNAMGGAVVLETRTGFSSPGWAGDVSLGSAGSQAVELRFGRRSERLATFAAVNVLEEDGWRDASPARLRQGYLDFTWAGERGGAGASVAVADNLLHGNGPAPVELLEEDRRAVFTHPDRTRPRGALLILRGDARLAGGEVEGRLFLRRTDTTTTNGDAADFVTCSDPALGEWLCADGGEEPLRGRGGALVPAFEEDLVAGALRRTRTRQTGWGGTLEARWQRRGLGGEHRIIAGMVADSARIGFASGEELALLDESRGARGTGVQLLDGLVGLDIEVENAAVYVGDVIVPTPRWTLLAAARYDLGRVRLRDRLGPDLDGDHRFSGLAPSLGASYLAAPGVVVFANAAQSTRNPTPVELTCANPEAPCRLPNAFVSDPPLDPVVTRAFELGVRTTFGGVHASLAAFHAESHDDILFIASGRRTGAGHFANVGATRRQGVEVAAGGSALAANWRLSYSWTDARFREAFRANSPSHPAAVDGEITVAPGDQLPGVPAHVLQLGADRAFGRLRLRLDLLATSGRILRGDEAGLLPELSGFARVDTGAEWTFRGGIALYAEIENLLDEDYATFGLLGEPDEVLPELEDPRFHSPGIGRTALIGLRWCAGD